MKLASVTLLLAAAVVLCSAQEIVSSEVKSDPILESSSHVETPVVDLNHDLVVDIVPPSYSPLPADLEQKVKTDGSKHVFKTEVNKLMKLIINSLYKSKEIFLRELVSNASDALDKIRYLAVTAPEELATAPELKISIVLDAKKNLIVLTDTGLGMTKDDLIKNLGTIAKSGTSEFIASMNKTDNANLIGQFGVGFYSVFLVADTVTVISKNNKDEQYIWESNSENEFSLYKDPRGDTLGRGTQIIIHLKPDSLEYLDEKTIKDLVKKYSQYINFPIFLWSSKEVTEAVPDLSDDLESDVEDVKESTDAKTVTKTVYDWDQLNSNKPLWVRQPSDISTIEYNDFYKSFAKATTDAMTWVHFKTEGDVEFRGLIFIPLVSPSNFLEKATDYRRIKLFVRRVFITDELVDFLPRYLSFITGIVDSDDLPLNVSRETLQQHALLASIKKKVISKVLDAIKKLSQNDPEKYDAFIKQYNTALKFGILEDKPNSKRLSKLIRIDTSFSAKLTSLDDYVSRMKTGQPQIYYITGSSLEDVKASPSVEKLIKRGYEVLYLTTPVDEYVVQNLGTYSGKKLQSAAKAGLQYGDEDEDNKRIEKENTEKFKPLAEWMKTTLGSQVSEVLISNRLTTSACTIVAGHYGNSALMEKLLLASNSNDARMNGKKQPKVFEINPSHPIIEAMLKRVEKPDEELTYTLNVLFDSALIRSGYDVNDSMIFAKNVEKVIRLNLKVGEMDEAVVDVKPAPATAPAEEATLESEEESEDADASVEEMMKGMGDGVKFSGKDQDGNVIMGGDHDEL